MKVFKSFNQSNEDVCPICGTNEEKETVLIGIVGTEDGGNMEAKQFHLACINLMYYPDENIIAQRLPNLENSND